jgi:GNAT superfamily N-acetyltransferase
MLLRQATLDDLPSLMALLRDIIPAMRAAGNLQWDDAYPNAEVFTRDINLNQLWLAEVDNQLAAIAALTTEQPLEYAQVGWNINDLAIVPHRLAVDPKFRGQGIAAALMLEAEAVARSLGTNILRVDTSSENPAPQKLFLKLGYTYAGEITLSYRPGLRVLCYQKLLP